MTFGLYPLLVCFIPRPEALPDLRLGTRGSPFPRLSEHLLSPPTPRGPAVPRAQPRPRGRDLSRWGAGTPGRAVGS